MSGHLEQVRPGVWKFRTYAGLTVDGKQRQRSKTFTAATRKEADKTATRIANEWNNESKEVARSQGTVAELVTDWFEFREAQGDSPYTLYRLESICRTIRADLGHIPAKELTTRDIDRWYTLLSKRPRIRTVKPAKGKPGKKLRPLPPMGPSTVGHYHRVLNAILHQSRKWKKIPWNPCEDATPPRKPQQEETHDMPTPEQLREMMAAASRSVRMACVLAAATGCRRGELLGLRWSHIDGNQLTIKRSLKKVPRAAVTAGPTKGRKERTITIDDDTLVALFAHRIEAEEIAAVSGAKLAADGPILAHLRQDPTGRTPFQPHWLTQEWTRLRDKHGLTANLHSLRHFHATHLIDRGVAISTVSKRLGHAQVSTTLDIYAGAVKASDDTAALVISEVISGLKVATS